MLTRPSLPLPSAVVESVDPSASAGTGPAEALSVPVVLAPGARAPDYALPGDAGADLRATGEHLIPAGGGRVTVGTGVRIALPLGYAAFVHPRSGLAARHGVTVLNAPGTVDAGYRGEIRVTMLNTDPGRAFRIAPGDRIAQLVVQRVERVSWDIVQELPASERGAGGFGSTGGFQGAPGASQ